MKKNILATAIASIALLSTAIATPGCSTSGQQEGNPERDLLVEVSPSQIISEWKKIPDDKAFDEALRAIDSVRIYDSERAPKDSRDYAKMFCEFYARHNPSADLYDVLNLPGLKPATTMQEAAEEINKAVEDKITNSVAPVLEKRLKDAGATYIDIKPAPGHSSTLRVLTGGLGKADLQRLISSKGSIDFLAGGAAEAKEALTEIDRRAANRLSSMSYSYSQIAGPRIDMHGGAHGLDFGHAIIGHFRQADKNEADSIINSEEAKTLLPAGIRLLWSYSPENYGENFYSLYALKEADASNIGQYITDAAAECDEIMGWYVSMKFNDEGAEIFERLTRDNIGRELAIVLDGKVLSAPRVNDKISGGNSQITGNFDETTCKMLATILKGGALTWKCEVIQSRPYSENTAGDDGELRDS